MKTRLFLLGALSAAAILFQCPATDAHAQEVCSADEVSDALNGLSCYADGAYVSPESVALAVSDLCYDDYSEASCYACFARARRKLYPTLKTLIKIGLVDPSSLRDYRNALADAEDETCYADGGFPWDAGANGKSQNGSKNGNRGRGSKD
jgi:hypothetical protein